MATNNSPTDQATATGPANPVAEVLRLDRGRRRWRLLAVVAVVLFVLTLLALGGRGATPQSSPHIAHIQIDGIIRDTLHQQKVLEDLRENDATRAVLVYVDSPGGTMVGGLNLHNALRRLAAEKPVVTVMGTVAASAGYMVSAAGDHVIASPGSITGSIGVMMPLVDATELAEKIGIRSEEVTSGDLKTATSPLRNRTEPEMAYLNDTVAEMQKVFMELIEARRPLTPETRKTISDGRILTGVSAHDLGLVDALGDRHSGREWLRTNKNIASDIPLVEVSLSEPKTFFENMLYSLQSQLFSKLNWQGIMASAR